LVGAYRLDFLLICIISISNDGEKVAKGLVAVKLTSRFWIKNTHYNLLNLKAYKRGRLICYAGMQCLSSTNWLKNRRLNRFVD
jgi:hypothetical protein